MSARKLAKLNGDAYFLAESPCKVHGTYMRFTANGNCPDCAKESTHKKRPHDDVEDLPVAYHSGRRARSRGEAKRPISTIPNVDKYWWLAGWNDRDMELQP